MKTLTQYFGKKENPNENKVSQESEEYESISMHQNSQNDIEDEENSVVDMVERGRPMPKDDDDDYDAEVEMTQQELFDFTQDFQEPDYEFEDDETENAPPPIDYSQSEYGQQEEDYSEPIKKRPRQDDGIFKNTDEKHYVNVGISRKIYKVGESYIDRKLPGDPENIFTITKLYMKSNVTMAVCRVTILARTAFKRLAPENGVLDLKSFEKKFGKYVTRRRSLNMKCIGLKFLYTGTVPETVLYYDPPPKQSMGPGFTLAFCFHKDFSDGLECDVEDAPEAIDLFAGSGLVSRALEDAGIKVMHVVDNNVTAKSTLQLNHDKETKVFCQSVESYIEEAKKAGANSPYCTTRISHCHCSSPCQGFSGINTHGCESKKEKNNNLCMTFPDAMISLDLITGTFENVTGMLQEKRRHYLKKMIMKFLFNDFQVRLGVIDSSHYGDPQSRVRVIMLVSKKGYRLPDLPQPTHGVGDGLKRIKTAGDAIGDLEAIEPRDEPGYVELSNGLWVDHHVRVHRQFTEEKFLSKDSPAHTMLCGHAVGHYNHERACTNLECARIQGFPDDWKFAGSEAEIRKQIGNAVPFAMATAMAKAIFDVYDHNPNAFTDSQDSLNSLIDPDSRRVSVG